jgi:DNA-directed RNA polymerase specialized sigma24 family protein
LSALKARLPIESPPGYIFTVLRRTCARYWQSVNGYETRGSMEDLEAIGPTLPPPQHVAAAARQLLLSLDRREAQALYMRYVLHLPPDKIGPKIGLLPGSSRKFLRRLMDRLRA